MKTFFLLAFSLFLQAPEPSARGYVYWQVDPAHLESAQIQVFSVCLDETPCVHVPPAESVMPEFPGWYRWKLPPLLVGTHRVSVQLCNAIECGPAVVEPFTFTLLPGAPSRVIVR